MTRKHQERITKEDGSVYVRDPASGQLYELRGAGALKGQIAFRSDLDLTKPIYEQVIRIEAGRKSNGRKTSRKVA